MTDRKIETRKVKLSHFLYITMTRSTCSEATHVTQSFVGDDLLDGLLLDKFVDR